MKILTSLGSTFRSIRLVVIAAVMFACFTGNGLQVVHADQFLDEMVEFTVGVFSLPSTNSTSTPLRPWLKPPMT